MVLFKMCSEPKALTFLRRTLLQCNCLPVAIRIFFQLIEWPHASTRVWQIEKAKYIYFLVKRCGNRGDKVKSQVKWFTQGEITKKFKIHQPKLSKELIMRSDRSIYYIRTRASYHITKHPKQRRNTLSITYVACLRSNTYDVSCSICRRCWYAQ